MRRFLIALALCSCELRPLPPPLPPPEGPGDCASACANLIELECGDFEAASCEADCDDVTAAEADLGARFPVGCLTAAKSCAEAGECR